MAKHMARLFIVSLACLVMVAGSAFASSATDLYFRGNYALDKQDYKNAFKWYAQSAKMGNSPASYKMGMMLARGLGAKRDYNKAVRWYTKAANQFYAPASFTLGLMYSRGDGVKQDYREAYKWFHIAAKSGHGTAEKRRDAIANKMDPFQLAEASKLVKQWMEENGNK